MPPILARAATDEFEREPTSYRDLRMLAADHPRDVLAGHTVINHATQFIIALAPDDLKTATRAGTPAALLLAIPVLPEMLPSPTPSRDPISK